MILDHFIPNRYKLKYTQIFYLKELDSKIKDFFGLHFEVVEKQNET